MVGGVEEGVVMPVVKKGDVGKVSDYRGVTRTQTAYKIYATVLAERLRKEMEGRRILPPGRLGFREGTVTMDNIYVLN